MAVATQTKGRNLDPYQRLRQGELQVLITPALASMTPTLRVSTRRWITKSFAVDFPGADACALED